MRKSPVFFCGEIISAYQLTAPLRVRDRSEIWCARRVTPGAPVAVKFLLPGHPRAERFPAICATLRGINCPSLIRILESSRTPSGIPFAVMEYASGGTLAHRLAVSGPLPLAQSVFVLRETLTALDALHRKDIVHRDVKPDNLWLTGDGEIRLGDFETAKLPGVTEQRGTVFGTASYMSPEQARSAASADPRSDLFSLASVLYEALTGERRYARGPFTAVLKTILGDRTPPPVKRLLEVVPGNLADLLVRMMEHSAALRPANAGAVLVELDRMDLPNETL